MARHYPEIIVVGGGLAGSEAAWQAARYGAQVRLYEMRPVVQTPAHKTERCAEIVCSNSFKSDEPGTAPFLLKEELRRAGSLLIEVASHHRVPAGSALAVDREKFSQEVTERLSANPNIEIIRQEMTIIPEDAICIIATGPLTSPRLSEEIARLMGSRHLYFYDAISPIVDAETIDYSIVFRAARYGKGGDDYLNCPMNEEQYNAFYEALISAESVPLHAFEETHYFEGCLPIEELARRGRDTLRFGPMKPVGLIDPRTGRQPFAAVQLRQENLMADSYNIVGFQNHLKFGEQKRVLRMIPGLEKAEFFQFGQIHRNTYINSPRLLSESLQMRSRPNIFFAGQISGVEGYVESIATGLMAGVSAARVQRGLEPLVPSRRTAFGSLVHYIANADANNFQPMNMTFALLPPLDPMLRRRAKTKAERRQMQIELASKDFAAWLDAVGRAT